MSRRGPGLQPHILSGSGACSLGPLAIVTFPLILEVILMNMVSWSSDISHTEPALDRGMNGQRGWCPMFCSLLQDQPYHWGFLWGKMKMTKKMALVAFSPGDFHRLGYWGAASQNFELRQWLKSSQSLGAPSRGGSLHRPQPTGCICSSTQSNLLSCCFICLLSIQTFIGSLIHSFRKEGLGAFFTPGPC